MIKTLSLAKFAEENLDSFQNRDFHFEVELGDLEKLIDDVFLQTLESFLQNFLDSYHRLECVDNFDLEFCGGLSRLSKFRNIAEKVLKRTGKRSLETSASARGVCLLETYKIFDSPVPDDVSLLWWTEGKKKNLKIFGENSLARTFRRVKFR